MSLDVTEYKDRAYNAYFIVAVMACFAVGGAIFYSTEKELNGMRMSWLQGSEATSSIQRAVKFDNFQCQYESYDSDIFLRKVTNQFHPIDELYVPENMVTIPVTYRHPRVSITDQQVREEVLNPVVTMIDAARKEGIDLRTNSAYRSHSRQKEIYDFNTDILLVTKPEKAARPGYSEHQLGTAIDLSEYPGNSQRGYDWLATNAYKYGFVLSYPEFRESITEFRHEPWHWRYVGTDIARHVYENKEVLFNHENAVILPSPIKEKTELPYEYTGRDMWVWKSLGNSSDLVPLVRGDNAAEYQIDVQAIISKMQNGYYLDDITNISLPIRDWILEMQTNVFIDEHDERWLRTTFASPKEESTVERIEILYREEVGYVIINFQNQDFADRFVVEITDSCGYVFKEQPSEFTETVTVEEEL